jgi:hypothetical protein
MYLISFVFAQYLSLTNDYIHRLDITVYIVLAAGHTGFGIISHCMVDHATFQAVGYCG